MIFGKSKMELKVGFFVFIGLIILFIFVMLIGDFKNLASAYRVRFVFQFINGVKIGAPVRFAGVDIGEVREINMVTDTVAKTTKIELVGLVRKGIRIPIDSQVWVNTLGLLGEKYIDIMPGQDYTTYVQKNGVMIGKDPVPMHEFGEMAKSIAQKLDESLSEIKLVAGSLDSIAKNVDDGIVRIKNKEGTVGKLLYDDALYKDLEDLVVDIKKHPWKLFFKGKETPEPKAK